MIILFREENRESFIETLEGKLSKNFKQGKQLLKDSMENIFY